MRPQMRLNLYETPVDLQVESGRMQWFTSSGGVYLNISGPNLALNLKQLKYC